MIGIFFWLPYTGFYGTVDCDKCDTEQPCTTAGPTTVEGFQLAEDGQKPSCPSNSQGEVEMVKRLYPMLFHRDVTGRESIAAETSTRL